MAGITSIKGKTGRFEMVVAFFDVDYTVLPSTSAERLFIRHLWRHGCFGFHDMTRAGLSILRTGKGTLSQRIKENKAYLGGRSVTDVTTLARSFVMEVLFPYLAAEALKKIEWHQQHGHQVVLLTGSLEMLVRPLAERLGIETVLCTRLEQDNGLYTGRLIPPHPYGEGKRIVLDKFVSDKGVDLLRSYAYGDSLADCRILEAVGHPCVVNPGLRMLCVAQCRGWPVLYW
jgi:HAD superfamily hydrolase (TIGR01490 family)